jgi:hypothetical protein
VTKGTAPSLNVSYNPPTNRQTGECADANGNLCASGYSYDVENRLSSTGSARYSYAPGNKQVWRGDWKSSSVPFSPPLVHNDQIWLNCGNVLGGMSNKGH